MKKRALIVFLIFILLSFSVHAFSFKEFLGLEEENNIIPQTNENLEFNAINVNPQQHLMDSNILTSTYLSQSPDALPPMQITPSMFLIEL